MQPPGNCATMTRQINNACSFAVSQNNQPAYVPFWVVVIVLIFKRCTKKWTKKNIRFWDHEQGVRYFFDLFASSSVGSWQWLRTIPKLLWCSKLYTPKNNINRFDVCLPVLWAQCGRIATVKDQFVKTLFLIWVLHTPRLMVLFRFRAFSLRTIFTFEL